jgi:hypothetical protein
MVQLHMPVNSGAHINTHVLCHRTDEWSYNTMKKHTNVPRDSINTPKIYLMDLQILFCKKTKVYFGGVRNHVPGKPGRLNYKETIDHASTRHDLGFV